MEVYCILTMRNDPLVKLDAVSGIYEKETFYRVTQKRLDESDAAWHLLRFDIDCFKMVNSLFGSGEGNRVLQSIGHILREQARPQDTYGRLGNDVFCMCVKRDRGDTVALVNTVIRKLQEYPLAYRLFLSAGIVEVTGECRAPVDILCDRAAMAQQKIKGNYLQPYIFFKMSMEQKLNRERELIFGMEHGLQDHQFTVLLQPQCDMRNGRMTGAEALARWWHPEFGMILPGEFIPLFERNGLIVELERYLWEMVCRAIRTWLNQGLVMVPISVNVSRMHLYDQEFCDHIAALRDRYSIPPSLLELEITESAYAEQIENLLPVIEKLQEAGFPVVMDDFGSGYSSLNMLKDIPVDMVKFDLNFLKKARKGEQVGWSIVRNMIQLMRDLQLTVIVEGVETKEQVESLQEMGCRYAQGYHYAQPMPLKDFECLLKNHAFMKKRV